MSREIFSACSRGDVGSVRKYIEEGGELDITHPCGSGDTLLHIAAWWGYIRVVRLLLENGAIIDSCNNDGDTTLHSAAEGAQAEVVSLLLENGAIIDSRNNDGYTPLHSAVEEGSVEITSILLEKGADPNSVNNEGFTPILLGITISEIVEKLVAYGANYEDIFNTKEFSELSKKEVENFEAALQKGLESRKLIHHELPGNCCGAEGYSGAEEAAIIIEEEVVVTELGAAPDELD